MASDQPLIPVTTSIASVLNRPATISMAALNAAVQWTVQAGGGYYISLTNGPAASSAWSATVSFQYSLNGGSTWNSLNVLPLTTPAAQVSSSTANGVWFIPPIVSSGTSNQSYLVRAIATAYVSGTVYADICAADKYNQKLILPWTYTVTSGQLVMSPIDASNIAAISVQISAITTTVLTAQGSNDPTFTTYTTLPVSSIGSSTSSVGTMSAAVTYKFSPMGMKYVRIACTTTGTVLSIQGITATFGTETNLTSFGNDLGITVNGGTLPTVTTVTTVSTVTSLSQIAASVPVMIAGNGATNKALGVIVSTALPSTDQNATAFAGAGRVVGTIVASANGSGAVISAEINVSALTLGTATGVLFILQESTGGSNFTDIWISDVVTTTGIIRVPAIPIGGRRRWCAFSIGGTSTTVTATITALELPAGSFPLTRQYRDAYSTTNPLTTQINSVTQSATTFGAATSLGVTTQATSVALVEGCKVITGTVVLAGSPTVTTQPVMTIELSNDATNWYTTTGTMTATGNGVYSASVINVAFRYARIRVTTAAAYSSGSYTLSSVCINGVN